MRSLWDSVLWLRRKNKQDKEEILTAVNAVQNLFKTSGEATASASDIVAPKTAYNGTTLITGTIADKTGTSEYAATASIDNTNKKIKMQVPADGKYGTKNYLYQSFSNIASLIGLTASKLVKNNTVLGITGNSSNMDTSGCDAAAAQILSGKKAGVKGKVVTGTMVNRAGTTVQAAAVTQDDDNTYFAVPEAAYYDKNSKIATANSNLILNSSFDCARMYYSRYYKTKQGYEINLKTGEYAIISLFNGGRGASTMPTIVDCTKVLETSSTFGSTTSTSDGGIVYLQVYQANSNSASITSDANWWNVGCLVVDKNTGNKLFNNYKAVYSYRNTKTSQNVSYNESIRKDNYIIVPTLVGGREGYICPEITNCDLVLCTPLITGNLTSSSDGGITGIEIYKARDNASIVGTASWWNTTAIITY